MTEPVAGDRRGSAPLAVGVVLLALLALLVAVLAATGDDGQPVATGSTDRRTSGLIPASDRQLAEADLVLYGARTEGADEDVVLLTLDGEEMGRGLLRGWYMNNPDRGADVEPQSGGWVVAEAAPLDEPVPGCPEVHGAGGLRVAVCGPDDRQPEEVRLLAADGRSRLLSGPVDENAGHWRWAVPSPNGRWVLAQWSGECEIPVAYLIEVASGERRPVVREGTETMGVGWAPDGKAVVGFWPGYCGEQGDRPGMYLVDPATRTRRWIHPYHQGALLRGG